MAIQQSGLRPASFPSPPPTSPVYQAGALRAKRFLRITQRTLSRHRTFQPVLLRETLDYVLCAHPLEYRAGFLDAIGAYVLLALEGCQLSPDTWDVLADVERR
ncbi:hypothetical protein [Ralstonia sp. UBA689]|uniref:hypothetical protein n=1 Tax=Ralstonia sp. UBA689 TaxID=1947373 RepID=UPI0025EA345B|nr:hypothetical protein [Ralstonia sp. UBA689]